MHCRRKSVVEIENEGIDRALLKNYKSDPRPNLEEAERYQIVVSVANHQAPVLD